MARKSILFSTTRGWNCGDEFILFGVRRALSDFGIVYNPVIFNRHPSITPKKFHARRPLLPATAAPHLDNSHSLEGFCGVDYVVFAGSPEWATGKRNLALHRFILKNNLRCSFIGVGLAGPRELGEDLKTILSERCDLFIARDPACYELVKGFPNTYYEVCPSLFSAREATVHPTPEGPKRVGFVIQTDKTPHQRISAELEAYCYDQFEKLNEKFPTTLVAHYIDEFKAAKARGYDVVYSGYSEDYPELFQAFDVVVSTRVHGCGLCASSGIPNALIPHDHRSDTVRKFESYVFGKGEAIADWVSGLDIEETSKRMVAYRARKHADYMSLFERHLGALR